MTGDGLRARVLARVDQEYRLEFSRGILLRRVPAAAASAAMASALVFESELLEDLRRRECIPYPPIVPLGGGGLPLD